MTWHSSIRKPHRPAQRVFRPHAGGIRLGWQGVELEGQTLPHGQHSGGTNIFYHISNRRPKFVRAHSITFARRCLGNQPQWRWSVEMHYTFTHAERHASKTHNRADLI